MKLWIRSQDRENLVKVDRLTIDDTNSIFCDYNDFYLGTYKTKERALEVLDEIQELLQPIYKVTNDLKKSELTGNCQWIEKQEYIPIQTKVYQMPED